MDRDGHCERFNELPEHTKVFLEGLTAEDISTVREGIAITRTTKTIARFWKWTAITVVAVFTGTAGLIASVDAIVAWLKRGGQ